MLQLWNPDRVSNKIYNLVVRGDHKACPKQVSRCEQCRVAFQACDIAIIKTTGHNAYDKNGKIIKYQANIYLHFLTNCLKQHDKKFQV